MAERLSLAQVTPQPWGTRHPVNEYVAELSRTLHARGHRVLVVAPSSGPEPVRTTRRRLRDAAEDPTTLFDEDGPTVLEVGEVLPLRAARGSSLPIDVARTIEQALTVAPLDFVHVHEPFAPSTSSAALRHSRSLNVGSFHGPTERLLSTQVARRVVELFFGRLDARTASFAATEALLTRFFPASYRVVSPGSALRPPPTRRPGALRIVLLADEERSALRLVLRALRRLDPDLDWEAIVWAPAGTAAAAVVERPGLRDRVRLAAEDEDPAVLLVDADVVVAASAGVHPAPSVLLGGLAAGAVPVAARLPVYDEILDEGTLGLLFEPGDLDTLVAQLERLLRDPELRGRLNAAADPVRERLGWGRVADEMEALYAEIAARRHDPTGRPDVRRRLAARALIDVDLHMHTDHSGDCATPVESLLAGAREQGLGAIAVTDHNEVSGALEARAKADGLKVIVGEEVKTANQGEVIGLFLERKIPRGLSLDETIAEIRAQGGLVYVPHPFDRLHTVPDYEHLLGILPQVDAIEVFNPRVAISSFNEEAVRFAAKYRIVAGAGSDAHVVQGLGSVRIRMRDFDGPEEFLESLRDADIVRKPASLVYVQALKFLQTRATPAGARRAVRDRRVRRATRS